MRRFVETLIENKLGRKDLSFKDLYEETGVNMMCVAAVIQTGKSLIFGKNHIDYSVVEAIMMSTAVPSYFPSVEFRDIKTGKRYQVVDGAVLNNTPVLPLVREGCDRVTLLSIGDINEDFRMRGPITSLKRLISFVGTGNEYQSMAWASHVLGDDFEVYHSKCEGIGLFDWNRMYEAVEEGIKSWDRGQIDPWNRVYQYDDIEEKVNHYELQRLIFQKEREDKEQ